MVAYRIEWKPSAVRELKRLDRQSIPRIVEAIVTLSSNPFPHGVRKLQGAERVYRMRVGQYRVIYQIEPESSSLQIMRIRHRKDAYRD